MHGGGFHLSRRHRAFRLAQAAVTASLLLCASSALADEANADRHGSAFLDPLGFLLFGPTVGAEAGVGHVTGIVRGRWLSPGLLGQRLFLNEGDSFALSWGLAGGARYYVDGGMAGPYAGAGFEYLRTRVENSGQLIATTSAYAVPQIEGGYRLDLGRVYAGGTLMLGYAKQLSGDVESLPGGTGASAYTATDHSSVYGAAALELGVFF